MKPAQTIAALRRLAGVGLTMPNDPEVQTIAAQLIAFIESDDPATLDEALGLSVERGEPSWRTARARNERNRLLRLAAYVFFPDTPPAAAAKALAAAWQEYWRGGWRNDKRAVVCPIHVKGTVQEALWRIMCAWPGAPLSAKQISEVLKLGETNTIVSHTDPEKSSSQVT